MNESTKREVDDSFITVRDADGIGGFVSRADVTSASPTHEGHVAARLSSGQQILIPSDSLQQTDADSYSVPFRFADIQARATDATLPQVDDEFLVVPVLAETLHVDKRAVEAGRVRVSKTVQERVETVDVPLLAEEVNVERVAVNRVIESAPPIRYEGDVMIVPLVEEVLVVEKRLMLREELHITKRQTQRHDHREVTLRSEQATVERIANTTIANTTEGAS